MKFKDLAFIVILGFAVFIVSYKILFDVSIASTTTTVTVSNPAPSFTVSAAESVASDGTNPTNVAVSTAFSATATDPDSENYYLAICRTNSVSANSGGSAPSCGGGNLCVSASTASGVQASCNYTAVIGDSESVAWYAFVCDAITGSSCSTSNQGSGSSGSPLSVNHRPTFTTITDGSANPSGTITFTATASDADTDTVADTVKLIVCSASGATTSGCTIPANELCSAALTSSNPTCDYNIPAVAVNGNVTYYSYIFDNHGFGATNNPFPTVSYTVNNVAPTVTNVTFNGGSDITLAENTTTPITITATVSDNNACTGISSVVTDAYRSSITATGCNTSGENNSNYCYARVSCTVVGGTCSGSTDPSANYTCSVSFQYHADPTDADTVYTADNWLSSVTGSDGSLTGSTEVSSGVEVQSLVALSVTSAINYGSLQLNSNTGGTNQSTVVTATGNVGLDVELAGADMTYSSSTIPVANQQYSDATFTYGAGIALSVTDTEVELNVAKTTTTVSPQTKNIYWGIAIPGGILTGTYSGSNTITAKKGETAAW